MPKLRLSLEDLSVESFDSTPAHGPSHGTVRGHEDTEDTCFLTVCGVYYTVEYFCGGSANGTCDESLCAGDTCGFELCPVTYDATCPAACRTQGVIC